MFLRTCAFFCLFALTSFGASGPDAPPASGPSAAVSIEPAAALEPTADKPAEQPVPNDEAYHPPFPEREELFQPPSVNRSATTRKDNTEVGLKGFIDVGGQRVVLSVNGRIKQLAVGESAGGVEVIQIDPPKVTLQRGRVRWTDTLFEVRAVPAGETALQNTEDHSVSLTPSPADVNAEPVDSATPPESQ